MTLLLGSVILFEVMKMDLVSILLGGKPMR